MQVERRLPIQNKLPCIDRAIMQAARNFMTRRHRKELGRNEHGFFLPIGPSCPIHVPTPYHLLQQHLDKLPIPEGTIALDAGSGLGSACFTMAADTRIGEVIGYEYDPEVFRSAVKLASRFKIDPVRFINESLFRASLIGIRLVYVYKPFIAHFDASMGRFLENTEPGTIVLSRDFTSRELFPDELFENIYIAPTPHHGHFFGYLRKLD